MQYNYVPHSSNLRKMRKIVAPKFFTRTNDLTGAIKTENQWLQGKTAEHDGHTPVFHDMRRRFAATAGQVQVTNSLGIKAAERVHSFGGNIDAALARRGGRKENFLLANELN